MGSDFISHYVITIRVKQLFVYDYLSVIYDLDPQTMRHNFRLMGYTLKRKLNQGVGVSIFGMNDHIPTAQSYKIVIIRMFQQCRIKFIIITIARTQNTKKKITNKQTTQNK